MRGTLECIVIYGRRHETEPGCTICAAIADGTLAAERFLALKSIKKKQNAVPPEQDI